MYVPKHIPANCDAPLTGKGDRRCKFAGIVETADGRMVCGHHARLIAADIDKHGPRPAGP